MWVEFHSMMKYLQCTTICASVSYSSQTPSRTESRSWRRWVTVTGNIHFRNISLIVLYQIVLELDKENEKAWYRHGQACLRLRDFHTAKTSFMKVQSLSGGVLCVYIVYISLSFIVTVSGKNKDLARFLAECEAELGKSRQRESEMYQAMFKLQTGAEWLVTNCDHNCLIHHHQSMFTLYHQNQSNFAPFRLTALCIVHCTLCNVSD